MKTMFSALFLLLLATVDAQAATGRAGEAAVRGSQTGYEEDRTAANETSEKELSFSDVLQQCVGGIAGAQTSTPFGGGGNIFEEIANRICSIARERVNGELNSDAKIRMASALQNIYQDYDARGSASTSTPSTSPSIRPATTSFTQQKSQVISDPANETTDSAFWNNIWK